MCHDYSAFVTLTYSDEKLPTLPSGVSTLAPKHASDWLKRFRERLRGMDHAPVRFYLVGEYGDTTHRPHYHAIIFGLEPCIYGRTRRDILDGKCRSDCCKWCSLVYDTWGSGLVEVGQVNRDSCAYIAGYVMKKMTRFDDPRLNGRNPEFARMSNRGGLGVGRVPKIAESLLHWGLDGELDVPLALLSGDKQKPLGRYLRRKLREALGRDGKAPQGVLDAMAAELLPLRQAAFDASRSFAKEVVSSTDGRYANFMARQSLYKKGRAL